MSPVRYRQLGQLWREAGPPQARFCKGPAMATTTTLRKTYLRKDKMPHGRVRGKSVRENPVFCLHFSTSRSTLLGNTLIFHKVESVSAMTAIGQWSPCYYLDPQAFSSHFLLCPVEEGSESTSGYCSPRSAHHMVDTLQQEKWNLRRNRRK